jgi:hypothetical protein
MTAGIHQKLVGVFANLALIGFQCRHILVHSQRGLLKNNAVGFGAVQAQVPVEPQTP